MQAQQGLGQEADDVVALDEPAGLVVEEAAVEIAVPGDAQVGLVQADRVRGHLPPLGQERVGHAVGEVPVRFVLQADEFAGQARGQQVDHRAGATVAAVHHQFERPQPTGIDQGEQKVDVGALVAHPGAGAGHGRGFGQGPPAPVLVRGQGGHRGQAGVAGERPGLRANDLHAVIVGRVVAGGDHDAAVHPGARAAEHGVVDLLGAAQADVDHVHAATEQGGDDRPGQGRAAQAHVPADHHPAHPAVFGAGQGDAGGDGLVQLRGNAAAHIVGGETAQGFGHGGFRKRVCKIRGNTVYTGGSERRQTPYPEGITGNRQLASFPCRPQQENQ